MKKEEGSEIQENTARSPEIEDCRCPGSVFVFVFVSNGLCDIPAVKDVRLVEFGRAPQNQ
jgi:hypothetical protein